LETQGKDIFMSEVIQAPLCKDAELLPNVLPLIQTGVLSLISQGNTVSQISRRLDVSTEQVNMAKKASLQALDATSVTSAVGIAIRRGILEVESSPEPELVSGLRKDDVTLLRYFALGGNYQGLSEETGANIRVISRDHSKLLERVRAWSKPHGVRRTYELGLLDLISSSSLGVGGRHV
jgi:DNA-binding CsgD family transcriptional regulator